jgi:bacterioferritin-associated ferredoxin
MVVCVCNAIRESDVREAARQGATSACQAYRALGLQPKCGQCVPFAREIINSTNVRLRHSHRFAVLMSVRN